MDEQQDIEEAAEQLKKGGIILYPTDTIWGIGCLADNREAVRRVFSIKKRDEAKSFIVLVANDLQLLKIVPYPPELSWQLIELSSRPITIVYDRVKDIVPEALAADGSMGIRIVRDDFCKKLIEKIKKPVISTSANISGEPSPACFAEISEEIKQNVDYICRHGRNEKKQSLSSTIIKLTDDNRVTIIRP